MDHNLEDSLNLESDIGAMDFGNTEDVVVSQADITLDAGPHDGGIGMEFENIEEQPMLMDTGNEEIIVSDFMGDQFNLQEYSVQDDQTTGVTTTEECNQQVVMASQADTMIDLRFEPQIVAPLSQEVKGKPKYIAVKAAPSVRPIAAKKTETTVVSSAPRQIAIAPKPPKLVPASNKLAFQPSKQFSLAPKPVALIANRSNLKKVPLSSIQGATKGSVLAQIGKQLVMMPSGSGQKIKLVTTSNTGMPTIQYIKAGTDQAQLITAKNVSSLQSGKPVMAKVIMQGQSNADMSNQPAVITKILPSSSAAAPQTRYIMQQKKVPISVGHKVLLSSPSKQSMVFTKRQQIIAIKPPAPKLMPAPAQGTTTKKVVITANPSQNVILKTTAPSKTGQVTKDGKVMLPGQRSELHQINVPGKGIQYIRLITNQTPASSKAATKTQTSVSSAKTFVLTDSEGIRSMAKSVVTQPPPLVYPGNVEKYPLKLVGLAPAPTSAKSTSLSQGSLRSVQSLLAPLSPMESSSKMDESEELPMLASKEAFDASLFEAGVEETELEETSDSKQELEVDQEVGIGSEVDSKAALHALIADAVAEPRSSLRQSSKEDEDSNSMEHLVPSGREEEHPLIVISDYVLPEEARDEQDDSRRSNVDDSYQSPNTPPDLAPGDLTFKPRRACNCTKSQCLKLYCDCFANGEFCNRCNCNNCHNNLENEELRQKAIRACLERNPNAFRPKIGKTKAGGPEIIRRHNKGCNCKRSGCLKNYCECYEAKIACTVMCKCVGCRNVEETLHRGRRHEPSHALYRPPALADPTALTKQPCSFMTTEVIEAVCQCLLAASVDNGEKQSPAAERDPVRDVIEEFSRCLQDIISAAHHHPQGHA